MKLLVPNASDPLSVAQNLKAILAVNLFEPSAKVISTDDVATPVLRIDEGNQMLIEPNAMVRYLAKKAPTRAEESVISFEETVLYNALKQGSKLDEKTCQLLSSKLQGSDLTVSNVIAFSALHGLVTFAGKGALSQDLQLLLWYQKFSGNPRVQPAVKTATQFVTKDGSTPPSGLSSRSVSAAGTPKAATPKPAAAAAPEKPKPENTGAVHVDESVKVRKPEDKILPKDGERNILITSALPYVNNVPHLGNIVGSVLSADIYARYAKARNYNTLYICGTDEYGTATETKALEEKMTPMELCTKYNRIHKQVYDWFQIGFDYFGRTSDPKQTEISQDIFLKLDKNGFLKEQTTEQLYCPEHNGYLADRFVEGTCKFCGYDDARGDQCDKCGHLLNPLELINPRCKLDNATPEIRSTEHVYLLLNELESEVKAWNDVAQEKGQWSKNGRTITENWFKEGLHPRAITRDLKWGVPVPLHKYHDKVLYVWFDACIGYISITAAYTDEWQKWWKDPNNVQLYQFMGKDNVPFHTVVFPASLIGTREEWTKLHHLSTTEYLQYEGGKFSKSRGLGVFGNNAQDIGVSPSVWRYYLAMARPETSDTQFSWSDFVSRNNSELLANLGNFVNRLVKFANAKFNGVLPKYSVDAIGESYTAFEADVNKLLAEYNESMEAVHLRRGLELAMHISARGNLFLQDNKLDNNLLNNFPEKCAAVIGVGLNLVYLLSALVTPFMPETTQGIIEQLNVPERSIPDKFDLAIKGDHCIGKAKYLFKRIEESKIDEWKAKYGGPQQK
ncbi:methionine--tRNA ligase, cytoplasmic [Trichomonascus vanleenenianus]|uniref:methionine--tRNA ligase MES1 n=1 Tax=Trichomonascus vanleenenianus TaxID=2268995 RepID=UPI003ECB4B4C